MARNLQTHLRECHLPYEITQYYLPPDMGESILPEPQPTYLPRRDERLS